MSYKQNTSFAAKAEKRSVRRGLNWGPFEYIILLFHGEAKDARALFDMELLSGTMSWEHNLLFANYFRKGKYKTLISCIYKFQVLHITTFV